MPYKPNYLCDLHCHTNRSDGNDEPAELIEKAVKLGMKVIAITDYDIVPPRDVKKRKEDRYMQVCPQLRH